MNKILLLLTFTLFQLSLFAQCDELFISQYVEGSSNNRALELYNASDNTIDLSEYSVGRFRNGSTTFTSGQIPEGYSIGPDETFVIVIDKRDSLGTGFEIPVWNGYVLMLPSIDTLTGEVRLDNNGDTILYASFNSDLERYEYGSYYREEYDLQSKADLFVNPVYQQSTSYFYFNGDDAVALIKGSQVSSDGSNIIDVVGVIGEDPEATTGNPYWVDGLGRRMTQNSTLIREPLIEQGTGVVAAFANDTFPYGEWSWRPNNTFDGLGEHLCSCHDMVNSNEESFSTGFSIELHSNPLNARTLEFSSNQEIESVRIFDGFGRELRSFPNRSSFNFSETLPNLRSGMYFMVVKNRFSELKVEKFVIN